MSVSSVVASFIASTNHPVVQKALATKLPTASRPKSITVIKPG
jgi:hypothetical protein